MFFKSVAVRLFGSVALAGTVFICSTFAFDFNNTISKRLS
jgi:hypothetical protein